MPWPHQGSALVCKQHAGPRLMCRHALLFKSNPSAHAHHSQARTALILPAESKVMTSTTFRTSPLSLLSLTKISQTAVDVPVLTWIVSTSTAGTAAQLHVNVE
eukprot:2438165-Prymnesium_polylepis.1